MGVLSCALLSFLHPWYCHPNVTAFVNLLPDSYLLPVFALGNLLFSCVGAAFYVLAFLPKFSLLANLGMYKAMEFLRSLRVLSLCIQATRFFCC